MPNQKLKTSRRELFKSSLAGAAYLSYSSVSHAQSSPTCSVGFNYSKFTINDVKVAPAVGEHQIETSYFKADSYVVGAASLETRYLLCVDPVSLHPAEAGPLASKKTLTDIYVFNQANNELLFWKKISSGEPFPGAMFVVSAAQHAQGLKLTLITRCSSTGHHGVDFNLTSAPPNYSTAVNAYDGAKLCAGVPIARPYIAPSATGGQGDLGILHRPNIIVQSDKVVRAFLGGQADGTDKHPKFGQDHYIMGGALFDQNGNMLSTPQTILYSAAGNHEVIFPVNGLMNSKVKVLRAVMFDSLQGRLMSFLDI